MPFQKGMARHPNSGRKPGQTARAVPAAVLEELKLRNFHLIDRILADIDLMLAPADRVAAMLKLMAFCYPQLKSIDIQATLQAEPVEVTPANVGELCQVARMAVRPEEKTAVGE